MDSTQRRLALVAVVLWAFGGGVGRAATQPNIPLIVADDVGAEASGLYQLAGGSGTAPMPNIDALAARGLVFENTWVNPMCSPTRSTILTGLYGHHTGVLTAGDVLAPSTATIWDYIRKTSPATYDMAVFGKWASGRQRRRHRARQEHPCAQLSGLLGAQVSDYFNWTAWDRNTGRSSQITTYTTTALTDWAIDFIKKHDAARPQDPWFLYLPYNAPHAPFQVPPGNLHAGNVEGRKPGTRSPTVPVYQAMIQALDTEIGRVLQHVDLKNTLVLYIGDNGTPANVKDSPAGGLCPVAPPPRSWGRAGRIPAIP